MTSPSPKGAQCIYRPRWRCVHWLCSAAAPQSLRRLNTRTSPANGRSMPHRATTLGTCFRGATAPATSRGVAGAAVGTQGWAEVVAGSVGAGASAADAGAGAGGAGGGMSDEQRQRMRQTMQLVFDAPPALTIAETDSSVAFAADSGAALLLYSDGRKVTQKVEGGGDVEIKGHWQGNDFVVERKVSGGG